MRTSTFLLSGMLSCLAATAPAGEIEGVSMLEKRDMFGRGTYYWQSGAFGSCGARNADSAFIVALGPAHRQGSSNCNRRLWAIALNGPGQGRRVECIVADSCPGCAADHVDFSFGAFQVLTNNNVDQGLIQVQWNWM